MEEKNPAAILGKKGGLATRKKYGKKHFKNLQEKSVEARNKMNDHKMSDEVPSTPVETAPAAPAQA